jgi:pimeloyl-ACP methyl ester carboxylesterase
MRNLRILFVIMILGARSGALAETTTSPTIDPAVARLEGNFVSDTAKVNGATLHYVRGGTGPALILVHGFPQDWYEWHAIMPRLAKQFTVVAVDLRGIGGSAATSNGYDAANMAEDIHQLVSTLKLERVFIVGHDIGGMVTYAFVRRYPQITRGAIILDVPLPGIDGWQEAMNSQTAWHVGFMQVPGLAEKLVNGRVADYLGYFFQFAKFSADDQAHYIKAYESPAQHHAAFEMYRAFPANEKFNAAQRDKTDVPLFYGAGEHSPFAKLLPKVAADLRAHGWTHVETGLIPGGVHYLVEDQPDALAELIEKYASAAKTTKK